MPPSVPEPAGAPPARRSRLAVALAFLGLPAALGVLGFLLSGAQANSFVAPFLGPFAGLAYGHSDCTMWNAMRGGSVAAIALGAFALGWLVRGPARRPVLTLLPGALWSLVWSALALLSILNTLS